jgi:hypothetical protein
MRRSGSAVGAANLRRRFEPQETFEAKRRSAVLDSPVQIIRDVSQFVQAVTEQEVGK